jgi:hypothetical protein
MQLVYYSLEVLFVSILIVFNKILFSKPVVPLLRMIVDFIAIVLRKRLKNSYIKRL